MIFDQHGTTFRGTDCPTERSVDTNDNLFLQTIIYVV